jgi:hypothetical protein
VAASDVATVENAFETLFPANEMATRAMMAISTTNRAYSTMLAPRSAFAQVVTLVQSASTVSPFAKKKPEWQSSLDRTNVLMGRSTHHQKTGLQQKEEEGPDGPSSWFVSW